MTTNPARRPVQTLRRPVHTRRPWLYRPFEVSRAWWESISLAPAWPLIRGGTALDEHPVLVVPGLGGGNVWTVPLRRCLESAGYQVHGIVPKSQHGIPRMVVKALASRIDELADQHQAPVSVVAWSVGGAYARQAAYLRQDRVRQLITLGSPLDGPWYVKEGRPARGVLPFPSTAIYSRTDGMYSWHRCIQPEGRWAENVEVFSSHFGMASNPLTVRVITDRLAQPPGAWQPYRSATPTHTAGLVRTAA